MYNLPPNSFAFSVIIIDPAEINVNIVVNMIEA
jgi:hypothetical protein